MLKRIYAKNVFDENVEEVNFKLLTFSGGEPHIQIEDKGKPFLNYEIDCRIQSFNDLGELLVAYNAIKNMGKWISKVKIPYFPGARQDRVANSGEAFTAKVYADILNKLDCKIEISDPHSDVTPSLLQGCKLYPIEKIIKQVLEDCQPDVIIIPDAGAVKRIEKYIALVNELTKISKRINVNYNLPLVQCLKTRDTKTGKLSGFKVCDPELVKGKNCLIIDDICDAGGTFIGLCEELDNLDAGDTYLYVTHGIFSKGYKSLLDNFTKIYTTDSFIPKEQSTQRVKVFNLY